MTEHAVVIAGGGPTGLMLAAELALAGTDVAVVERRTTAQLESSRSGGLHARSIEVLDQRGVADRFISQGYTAQVASFASVSLDISDFPSRHPYTLALWQNRFEEILAGWVEELGVRVRRGEAAGGFTQDGDGVEVELESGSHLRASYLVACDGGRSAIRRAAGIEFTGCEPEVSYLVAEVDMREEPEGGLQRDAIGVHAMGRLDDGRVRVVVREQELRRGGEPTLEDLSRELVAVRGTDYGLERADWISRFTDLTRLAASYRSGRVLIAGDAAHIHSPLGGQGLQMGIQDAVNLGWKLAQVVAGTSPEGLLDTYHDERHPVAARVLHTNLANTVFGRSTPRIDALRESMGELLSMHEPRRRFGAMMTGLDIHYDLGQGHPLLGRRMPDLDIVTADGPLTVYTLLHRARPALLNLADPGSLAIGSWAERVQLVDASAQGPWELPALGEVDAPTAVLVRPDGHVAWVGEGTDAGLDEALTTWFGPPRSRPD